MKTLQMALTSGWQVLWISLLLGAGIPAVFALGVRSLAAGNGRVDGVARPNPMGKVLALVCFALVALAILLGLTIIVGSGLGKTVSFEHIIPVLVDKKK